MDEFHLQPCMHGCFDLRDEFQCLIEKWERFGFQEVRFNHRADDVARDRSEYNQDSVGKSLSINRRSREAGGAGAS